MTLEKHFEERLARQPKSPEEAGPEHPFICVRCGGEFAEGAEGFVDRRGFPVHTRCSSPGELEEYKNANNGNGYRLNKEFFPAWYQK